MPDIFISYSQQDRERVKHLAHALEQRGFDVWWDTELKPGENYTTKIQQALDTVKAAIVVWSEASLKSTFVLDEAAYARGRGVIVPVKIDHVNQPIGFGAFQVGDLTQWPGPVGEPEFQRVVAALESLCGKPSSTAPPMPAASSDFSRPAWSAPQPAHAQAAPAKKPFPLGAVALGAGGALVAVVALLAWIGAQSEDPTEAGGGGVTDTCAAQELYCLERGEIDTLEGGQLIDLALQRTQIEAIEAGAAAGDPLGQTLLCLGHDWGKGVAADTVKARENCEAASEQGSGLATYLLSLYMLNGSGGYTKDQERGLEMMRKAAFDQGDSRALGDLALRTLNGDIVAQDDKEALRLMKLSAERGYPTAQFNLAWMYENGRGAEQDYATALLWYKRLSEDGAANGIRAVGWMHQNGYGVTKDLQQARLLYEEASAKGDGNATALLAELHFNGMGVAKDPDKAIDLFRLAVNQGFNDARTRLEEIGAPAE